MVDEYRAFVAPWGFAPDEVVAPTRVYQGTVDSLVPPSGPMCSRRCIPDATVTEFDGEGHMIAISRRAEIVRALASDAGTSGVGGDAEAGVAGRARGLAPEAGRHPIAAAVREVAEVRAAALHAPVAARRPARVRGRRRPRSTRCRTSRRTTPTRCR